MLAEAQEAALRLRELLPVLLFMSEPRRESQSTPINPSYSADFEELGKAIDAFVANPRSKPEVWFGTPVAGWHAARVALMTNADAELPTI
jgi:hypothetical protein